MYYCSLRGKICHRTRKSARRHLRSLKEQKGYRGGEVYICPFCKWFHVGRPRSKVRVEKVRRQPRHYVWRVEYEDE